MLYPIHGLVVKELSAHLIILLPDGVSQSTALDIAIKIVCFNSFHFS